MLQLQSIRLFRLVRLFALIIFTTGVVQTALYGQDTVYARKVITKLAGKGMAGRGYVKKGCNKAATYIARELKTAGVKQYLPGKWVHEFTAAVNTFPYKLTVQINGATLKPGVDYLVDADWSGNLQAMGRLLRMKEADTAWLFESVEWKRLPGIPVIPERMMKNPRFEKRILEWIKFQQYRIWLLAVEKLPAWTVAPGNTRTCQIYVVDSLLKQADWVDVKVRSKVVPAYKTANVIGIVPGTRRPDSLLVFTAHYDHLGMMGQAIFPGANDNASGVAMLLDLARNISKEPLPYSVVFVFFGGEEAGLLGSAAMVKDRILPLRNIRFLLNLDLVGTGESGMTVVNATVFQQEFALVDSLNKAGGWLPEVRKRGKAANSDHYFFTEAGVPSFFWYQSGPRASYHDVYDVPATLSLHGYNATFHLIMYFYRSLSNYRF
jgi:aminopeptidase YwaD